jgi:hypothetical protein
MPICQTPSFTGITNIYHLFYIYNMREVLIDKACHDYVDKVFTKISHLLVDFNITEPIQPDYLRAADIENYGATPYLLNSKMKKKYDLLVIKSENVKTFIPFMHLAVYIFVLDARESDPVLLPFTKVNDCFEGMLYMNDFHSIIFPYVKLDLFEQTYVRDKPYRFLKKMESLMNHYGAKVIVELGSCRSVVKHPIDELNPMCCNDSHSTFFWCRTKATVHTVDINDACESVLGRGFDDGFLKIKGYLKIHIEDGLQYLKEYEGEPIDFLFLDAWDVVAGTDYAEKHLEAYEYAKENLNKERAFIGIDDTDIASGGKGKLLIPKLLDEGWMILYKGRHTVLYKGSVDLLFSKETIR